MNRSKAAKSAYAEAREGYIETRGEYVRLIREAFARSVECDYNNAAEMARQAREKATDSVSFAKRMRRRGFPYGVIASVKSELSVLRAEDVREVNMDMQKEADGRQAART